MEGKILSTQKIIFFSFLLAVTSWLGFIAATEVIPFDTDEADKANSALELTEAIQSGKAFDIYEAVVRQSFYPPLHSFILAPTYLLFGPSLSSSRIPSVLMYFLSIGIFYFAISRHEKREGTGVLFASILFSLSPIFLLNSALCMLEPLGVLLTSFLLLILTHNVRAPHIWLSLLSLLFFFGKYTFAVTGVPACAFALYLLWRDGKVSSKGLLHFAIIISLPIAAWLFVSNRESIEAFVTGRERRFPVFSYRNLSLYPRLFFRHFTPHWLIGFSVILFALLSIRSPKFSVAYKTSWFLLVLTLIVYTVATTKGGRHVLYAAPTLWFLTGVGVNTSLGLFTERLQRLLSLLMIVGLVLSFAVRHQDISRYIRGGFEGEPEFSLLIDFAFSNSNPCEPILVLGASDSFSLEALRWEAAKRCGTKYTDAVVDRFPSTRAIRNHSKIMNRNLGAPWTAKGVPVKPLKKVLESGFYKRVFVIEGPNLIYSKYSTLFNSYHSEEETAGQWKIKVLLPKGLEKVS